MEMLVDWLQGVAISAGLFLVYVAIYSSMCRFFVSLPKFSKRDWRQMGIGLTVLASVGIPAALILGKFNPGSAAWKRSLFVTILMIFVLRFFRRGRRPETP